LNFEHLLDIIVKNELKVKQNSFLKKQIKNFVQNYLFTLSFKLKKLKLGLVRFEIKQVFFSNIFLYDFIEMQYIRQDTTKEDELKIDKRLDALK
jgi:hypothetical protein